ncbi:hypothetical protein BHM03_00038608 [Ensete ventricosum]|nr:hypothetical protein BHM03_00038608 [Ensete ventricosum]
MVNLKVRTPSQAVSIFPSKMVFFAAAISRSILRRVAKPYVFPRRWISGGASGVDGITAAGYHVTGGPSFMRGTVFWEPNRPLTIEEFHMPKPKAGEILIKTKGHGWILRFQFVFAFASPVRSYVLVTEESTSCGNHVIKFTSSVMSECLLFVCSLFYIGKPVYMYSMGGMAEYCVVPANGLAALPNSLPYTESAILGCAVFTAYGAMRHAAEMRAGDSVAVIGVGGVGSSCLQIARAFGAAEIIAVDVLDEKLQNAKMLGATHTINGLKEDVVDKIKVDILISSFPSEITGGRGVDVAVEALGKPLTFMQCTKSVRDGGKAVMIGLAPTNAIGEVDITRLVRRQVTF